MTAVLALLIVAFGAAGDSCTMPAWALALPGGELYPQAVTTQFARIACVDATMETFTRYLGRPTGLSVLFVRAESDWTKEGTGDVRLDIDMANATPEEVLNQAVRQHPTYVWFPGGDSVVSVVPADVIADGDSWLNYRVSYEANAKPLRGVFRDIFRLADEAGHPITSTVGGGLRIGDADGKLSPDPDEQTITVSVHDRPLIELFQVALGAAEPGVCLEISGRWYSGAWHNA
ncbi:MAG: hypothetical protein JXR94_03730, partial [Candidatus Hydrogenedentes bacterium]|nr:hypothetical protein [Candidatus Hydrogenedentota bacterium]